jgi:hypothetical protein
MEIWYVLTHGLTRQIQQQSMYMKLNEHASPASHVKDVKQLEVKKSISF